MFLRRHQWSAEYARAQVERFAKQHYESCHNAACFYTENFKSVEAEDVLQQAFEQLIKDSPTFEDLSDKYLNDCVHRTMRSIVLASVDFVDVIKRVSYFQNFPDNSPPVDELVSQHYEHEFLNNVLDNLPKLCKEYLIQKYISQYSDAMISKKLHVPVAQLPMLAKYAIHTARKFIKKNRGRCFDAGEGIR